MNRVNTPLERVDADVSSRPHHTGWFLPLFVLVGIGVVFLVGLAGGAALSRLTSKDGPPRLDPTATVVTEIQSLAQLVTVKYVLEKVVRLDDIKWYGQNRLLILAHGVVKAGVDFQRVGADDLSVHEGKIRIRLPKPKIFDVYLDEHQTEVIERSTGMLRSFDQTMEQEARRQAVDEIRQAARAAGILQEAEDRARAQLGALARASGYPNVEISFH